MTDIFGGIFDSVGSLWDSIPDSVKSATGNALKTYSDGNKPLGVSPNSLDDGGLGLKMTYDFQATPGKAVESVDPELYEAKWKQRLAKWAEVQAETGVKK